MENRCKGCEININSGLLCEACAKKGKVIIEPEIYSRVVGYMRPVRAWNKGKQQEFKDRSMFDKTLKEGKYV